MFGALLHSTAMGHRRFDLIGASGTVGGAALDSELCNATPFGQVPRNGFFALNNNYGRGPFVNGVDYTSTILGYKATWPNGIVFNWSWPDATSGSSYAYAYPLLSYGTSVYDSGHVVSPAPKQIKDFIALTGTYDISLGGNLNSFNVLVDFFVTAVPNPTDESYVAEVSFYPYDVPGKPVHGSSHTFSFGDAYVWQSGQEILIGPVVNGTSTSRNILSGTIDFKEILTYLVSLGWLTGNEYVRTSQFGVEVQVPSIYNTTPHKGSMVINNISYDWR